MNDLQYNTRELTPREAMLRLGAQYIGLQEIPGKENNPIILSWFSDIGYSWVQDDETAWCSCFINWLAYSVRAEMSGKLDARSWLKVGKSVSSPEPGDIAVYWRESIRSWKGHVGLFTGYTKNSLGIWTLGGNQENQVKNSIYSEYRLLDFRRVKYTEK